MVIGFRSQTDGFAYVILDGTQSSPNCVYRDNRHLPVGVAWIEALAWVRRQADEIFNSYQIAGACIKTIEHNAIKKSIERIQIEAILMEYMFSVRHLTCEVRVKAQIKRAVPTFREPARYLDRLVASHNNLRELNTPAYQDATIAAISVLPRE
jgi:hypothetical protein